MNEEGWVPVEQLLES